MKLFAILMVGMFLSGAALADTLGPYSPLQTIAQKERPSKVLKKTGVVACYPGTADCGQWCCSCGYCTPDGCSRPSCTPPY
jgi:hypothetical protein